MSNPTQASDDELRKQIENKLYMTDHSIYYEMRSLKPGDNREYGGKSFDAKIAMDNVMNLIHQHTATAVEEAKIEGAIYVHKKYFPGCDGNCEMMKVVITQLNRTSKETDDE